MRWSMRRLSAIALLALVYLVAAKLGLQLASVSRYATAVWPPTGIALSVLLVWGYWLWPGILIGAFMANVTTGGAISLVTILASAGIALGNTLEAWCGAFLVNRFAGGRLAFARAQDVFRFAALAALGSTTVSATLGTASLSLAGLAGWHDAPAIWLTWWIGDAGGDLVLAPALILWAKDWRSSWSPARALEAGLCLLTVGVTALAAFTYALAPGPPHLGLAFVCLPALLWAAFRLGPRESAAAMLLLAGFAVWGARHGLRAGPLSAAGVLLEAQAYLGVTAVIVLAVAAEVSRRREHENTLERQAGALRQQGRLLNLAHVLVLDADHRITFWSAGAERLYGFTPAEAIGRVSHALLQTRFPEPPGGIFAKFFKEGLWEGELRHKTRDGREVVVSSLWVLDRGKQGAPAAILEVDSDITERRRAEGMFRLAVESAPNAMILVDQEGRILLVNSQAEKLFGYGREELAGERIELLVPEQYRRTHLEDRKSFLAAPQARLMGAGRELYARRKDGSEFPVEIGLNPIETANGIWVLSAVVDITDRKRAEEERAQLQKLQSLGVLAGGVAHDFNNLLTGILGNTSLALGELPPDHPAQAWLRESVAASERAAALVQQLLAYAGKGRFSVQAVDLSELVRETAQSIQAAIPKGAEVRLELAKDLPLIEADARLIQQLVLSLLTNSAEAIGEAGTIRVTTGVQRLDEAASRTLFPNDGIAPGTYVSLEVSDTGAGMDPATMGHIFDPFFSTKFAGRGLGLAAALGIVRSHKGAIRADSAVGRGTTMTVILPVAGELAVQPAAAPEVEPPGPLGGNETILIVDDEPTVRSASKAALERYGYSVLLAENGQEAVEIFRHRAQDIAVTVLDWTMPVIGGEQAFRALRRIRPDAKIILSSGYGELEATRHFRGQGLAGFLQKPYTATQLAEKIKSLLDTPGQRLQM